MRPEEFRRLVKEDAGRLEARAINGALDYYIKRMMLTREHVPECVAYARGLAAGTATPPDAAGEIALTPSMLVTSGQLAEAIRPEVERVREEIFQKREAPFRSLEDAASWIEATAKTQRQASALDRRRAKAIEGEMLARIRDLRLLLKLDVAFEYRAAILAYVKPGEDWIHHVPALLGSPLVPLAAVARELSRRTGLHEAAVTAFILAGVPPLLPPTRVTTMQTFPGQKTVVGLPMSRATIELFTRDLSFQELRGIYRQVRASLGVERSKRIDARHVVLVETVRKLGGVPRRGSRRWGAVTKFWETVRAEVNRKCPTAPLSSWRAMEMAYRRLSEKLPV